MQLSRKPCDKSGKYFTSMFMVVDQAKPKNSVIEIAASRSEIRCRIQIGVGRHVSYMIRDFRSVFQRFNFF
jgi:hypothetical protein